MPALPRQKACIACAESKRRCDKQRPECQRCLDRDVDCAYPAPRRRQRTSEPRPGSDPRRGNYAERPYFSHIDSRTAAVPGLDFVSLSASPPEDDRLGNGIPQVSTLPSLFDTRITSSGLFIRSRPRPAERPWFLEDKTWAKIPCNEQPACISFVDLEPFIQAVEEMLHAWVRNGTNGFIHRRLYERGMPLDLQDAFTTVAAYASRTPAVKETILQIAEDHASRIVKSAVETTDCPGVFAHLARVQALFAYEFILLFDGSIKRRAPAEKRLPILRQWVLQMYEAVKRCRGKKGAASEDGGEFDKEYNTMAETWQLWVLTESVRRTHLVVDTIANIYQIMVEGMADCAGAVMFTARRGLWDADSAAEWFELSQAKPPLMVPSLRPGPLLSQHGADEFDDFVKLYWTFLVGPDKIQSWIDRGRSAEL